MRLQIASTVAAVIAQPKLSDELRDLLARHVRAQPDHRRAQVGAKRPCRRSRGNVGQSDLATAPATTPQPLMLGHPAYDRGQLPDLMADRLTDLLADGQVATAAIAALGRMGQRRVGIADHLTMTTLMVPAGHRAWDPTTFAPHAWASAASAADRWRAGASC